MKYIYQNVLSIPVWRVFNLLGIPLILFHAYENLGTIGFPQVIGALLLPSLLMCFLRFLCDGMIFTKLFYMILSKRIKDGEIPTSRKFIDPFDSKCYAITTPRLMARTFNTDLLTVMLILRYNGKYFRIHKENKNQFLTTYKIACEE